MKKPLCRLPVYSLIFVICFCQFYVGCDDKDQSNAGSLEERADAARANVERMRAADLKAAYLAKNREYLGNVDKYSVENDYVKPTPNVPQKAQETPREWRLDIHFSIVISPLALPGDKR